MITRVTPAESRMVLMGRDGPREGKILRNKFECKLCGKHKGGVSYEIHDYMICDDCVKDLCDARSATGFTVTTPVDFGTEDGEQRTITEEGETPLNNRGNTPRDVSRGGPARIYTGEREDRTTPDVLTPPVNSEGDVIEDAPTDMYTNKEEGTTPVDEDFRTLPNGIEGDFSKRRRGRK